MKNWKFIAAALVLALSVTACSGDKENAKETEMPEKSYSSILELLENDKSTDGEETTTSTTTVLNPEAVTLNETATELYVNGENPTFDKENNAIIFIVNETLTYDASSPVSVAISGDDILLPEGTIVSDDYPTLHTEGGYCGAAIKLSETLEPGDYRFSINFGIYTIGFKCTVH